jgi:signal peptidase II
MEVFMTSLDPVPPSRKAPPFALLSAVAAGILILDQVSKGMVHGWVPLYSAARFGPFFNLTHVLNTGASFSMFPDANRAFIGLTIVILAVLAVLHRRLAGEGALTAFGVACLWGGALGNLADRLRRGAVVDFLDFHLGVHHWPAFNVADSAITVGVALMFLQNIARARK